MYIKHVPLTVFSAILTLKNMHYMCMLTSLFYITITFLLYRKFDERHKNITCKFSLTKTTEVLYTLVTDKYSDYFVAFSRKCYGCK